MKPKLKNPNPAPIYPIAHRVHLLGSEDGKFAIEVGFKLSIPHDSEAVEVGLRFLFNLDGAAALALDLEETLREAVRRLAERN